MRFSFRRAKPVITTEESTIDPHAGSGLGIFSPTADPTEADTAKEYRKLGDLDAILVRSKHLDSLDDVPFIVNEVRQGCIVLLDITRLTDGSPQTYLELKRIVERIRGETRSFSADIALVNDSCMIVTPPFVKMQTSAS